TAEEREVWPDPGAIALTIEDGRFFGGELVVSESGRYWFQLQDDRGFRSGRPETSRTQAREDRKPSVRIIAPGRGSEQVSPRARVRIAVEVEDDYGIRGGVLEGRYFAPGSDAPVPQSLPLEGLVAAGVLSPRDALREGTSEFWLDVASLSTGSALPPEPGGRFAFFALAEDFGITDQKHPDGRTMGNIGESQVRLLEIVDERTLERLLIDRLMLVRDQLRQILSRQRALRMNLGEIEDAA